MLTLLTDYAARAVNRLAFQFKQSPLLKGMVTAIADEAQELENALYGLLVTRDVNNANDKALDNLGSLVGAPQRGAKNNTQYRNRVKVQVKANKSHGLDATIYEIAKLMVTAWNVAGQPRIYEDAHRGYYLRSDKDVAGVVSDLDEVLELARLLPEVNPAGVRAIVIHQSVEDADAFCFANGPGKGFGEGALNGAYDGKQ